MKELKKVFTGTGEVKGFKFTQISYANHVYLYKVDTGNTIYYEVFKRVENRRFACVSSPAANWFGKWAWTYSTLEKAEVKLRQLIHND